MPVQLHNFCERSAVVDNEVEEVPVLLPGVFLSYPLSREDLTVLSEEVTGRGNERNLIVCAAFAMNKSYTIDCS